MHDILLNIDNKEIFIEILHHSIDYLIGNKNDDDTLRFYHKYGFQSPDDFMLTTRTIAQCYRRFCSESGSTEAELLSEFANINPDLQRLVPIVLAARRPEIMRYLIRCQNAQEHPLVESFDWDVRLVMGDSSYAQNIRPLTTVTFNCCDADGKHKELHFEMGKEKLREFIGALERAVEASENKSTCHDKSITEE